MGSAATTVSISNLAFAKQPWSVILPARSVRHKSLHLLDALHLFEFPQDFETKSSIGFKSNQKLL
jgi:hypothetical protein